MSSTMKTLSPSKACGAKCMYAVMKYMKEHDNKVTFKEVGELMPSLVTLTDWEKERAGKLKNIRWWSITSFYSVDYTKAEFILKKDGVWYLTPEGETALKKPAEEVMKIANEAYCKWKIKKDAEAASSDDDDVDTKEGINLEELESIAKESIISAINNKNPYEFQDMVGALLRAMGYYTPFIAPKGKDGGIDIIAYQDPLGIKTPRIKVQVKHKPETAIPAKDIRALRGVMSTGDVGLFVTTGYYSADAKRETATDNKFIRLIDGDEFISMWQSYFDKMTDEDKNMLPLKRIAFLGSND